MTDDEDDHEIEIEIDDLRRPPGPTGKSWRVWRCPVCSSPMAIYEELPAKPFPIDCFGCGHRERYGMPMQEPGVRS